MGRTAYGAWRKRDVCILCVEGGSSSSGQVVVSYKQNNRRNALDWPREHNVVLSSSPAYDTTTDSGIVMSVRGTDLDLGGTAMLD